MRGERGRDGGRKGGRREREAYYHDSLSSE